MYYKKQYYGDFVYKVPFDLITVITDTNVHSYHHDVFE